MRALCIVFVFLSAFSLQAQILKNSPRKPKLLIVLVVDQLKDNTFSRYQKRLLPAKSKAGLGGYKFLTETGAYFPSAEYNLLQAMTCAGHAMILTGSLPAQNGIVLNEWFDRASKSTVYCAEDSKWGRSSLRNKANTVGDELKLAGYKSKVVGIALKDRSAIMLAGHSGDHVYWFDSKSFQWTTSNKYSAEGLLPEWVQKKNTAIKKSLGQEYLWKSTANNFSLKTKIGESSSLITPLGVEYTFELAELALKNLKLGQGQDTDVLAISLSGHDGIGHRHGPNSREMEEITVAEDRALAKFFTGLQKSGLLDKSLIVLTADHGASPAPSWVETKKIPTGKISESDLSKKMADALDQKFGKPKNKSWFSASMSLNFYFDYETLKSKKLELASAEALAKEVLLEEESIVYVITSSDVENGILPAGLTGEFLKNTYRPRQNGDLIIIPRPFYMSGGGAATTHQTSYTYDRNVPLVFWGSHIKQGVYTNKAHITDIAPTLSFYLGVTAPAMSQGQVLQIFK